jgi:ubiquitin-conjugating enzyme E2 Q
MIQSGVCSALNGAEFQPPEQYQDGDQMDEDDASPHFDPSDLSDLGEPDDFDDEGHHPFVNQTPSSMRQKVRQDLRALKESGFRVGYFGDIAEGITISAASRLSKLGIPEEATDVWKVHPNDYLVLLLRYPRGYLDMQDLFKTGDSNFSYVQMRLGLCDSYKPSATAAVMAFQGSTPTEKDDSDPQGKDKTKLRTLFIGNQLNSLLNDRFMGIVRLRL